MTRTPSSVPPLPATLARDLRNFASKLRRRLRAHGDAGDLTPSQTAGLLRLEQDGPQTTSGLARLEGMRPQSMRTIVAALQNAGLVSGSPDPDDGRQTILTLSDYCREWLKAGRTARQDWLTAAIESRLSPEEQHEVETAIVLLRRLID